MDTATLSYSNTLHMFTPVRQRGYTNNVTPIQANEGTNWTTARCHRLLRALTSRVAILTRDLARFSGANQSDSSTAQIPRASISPDGDWNQTKRKVRQTYSSKGRKGNHRQRGEMVRILPQNKSKRSLDPGEISVPTPILVRARAERSEADVAPNVRSEAEDHNQARYKRRRTRYGVDDSSSSFHLSESMREIRQKTPAPRYTTYEGIYSGLEALLVATASTKTQVKRRGARSLFSMALRAVPRYISQQEALVEAHIEKTGRKSAFPSRDMSTEIYDELEDFGSSGHGWKQLKIVVRSHGIQVLTEAIGAGILEVDYIGCLITLCLRLSAVDEAQTLLSSLLSSSNFAPPRSIYEKPNRLISMLWKFTEHTGSRTFQYRELLNLFNLGLLPIDWVATKNFGHVWMGLFQTLSSFESPEVLLFLNALLPMLASATSTELIVANTVMSEALENTFSSILTTLSSIVILSDERETPSIDLNSVTPLVSSKNIMSLLEACGTPIQGQTEKACVLPILATVFALGKTNNESIHVFINLLQEQLQQENGSNQSAYAQAVSFTCSTARCCGRGALSSGFEHLQHMHRLLEVGDEGGRRNILKSLIVDSAFAFAEESPDLEHLQHAAQMDTKFCVRRFEPNTTSHSLEDKHRSGFRWEEGIGEWVTASPLAAKKLSALGMAKDAIECDTPYRPPASRRRDAESLPPPGTPSESEEEEEEEGEDNVMESPPSSVDFDFLSNYEISQICIEEGDISNRSESDDELGPDSSLLNGPCLSDTSFNSMEMLSSEEAFSSTTPSHSISYLKSPAPRHSFEWTTTTNRSSANMSEDWIMFEDSSMSIPSSRGSNEGSAPKRYSIDRAPRMGRKALRSSQTWRVFDESDDELSFVSVSSHDEKVLKEVTNTSINNGRLRKETDKMPSGPLKPSQRRIVVDNDSEDELCF